MPIVTKEKKTFSVDSILLFQRLVEIAETSPDTVQTVFEYELKNISTSLFDASRLLGPASKHFLADYLWSATSQQNNSKPPDDAFFVLDGGNLLHRSEHYGVHHPELWQPGDCSF